MLGSETPESPREVPEPDQEPLEMPDEPEAPEVLLEQPGRGPAPNPRT